jgi:hypothetical protein
MRQEESGNPVRKPRRGKVLDGLNERVSEWGGRETEEGGGHSGRVSTKRRILSRADSFLHMYIHQGCQMVYFHTKNTNLGIFWRTCWMLAYFMTIWNILRQLHSTFYAVWHT